MENKIFHAVLAAFGLAVSIGDGLAAETKYGTIHVVQKGTMLHAFVAVPAYSNVEYKPHLTIASVAQVDDFVLTSTIKLMFT